MKGKKLLAAFLAALMTIGLVPAVAFAEGEEVAWIDGVGYPTLEAAVNAAKSGATITLGEGKYTLYEKEAVTIGKDLTFVGQGADKTAWGIGATIPDPDKFGTEYNGDYSFDGAGTITFKNMTLQSGSVDYLGFIRADNTIVEDCTINGKTFYWGYKSATFKNTLFNAPEGDYAIWTYCSPTMKFDGCTFNVSGKAINVYRESGDFDVTVNYKDCSVVSTKDGKAVMNINDSLMGDSKFIINISGKNTVYGLTSDDANKEYKKDQKDITCSKIFEFNTKYGAGNSGRTVINIDGITVWQDGKMVSHAIDTENDKYTDGYKDNAFTVNTGEWQTDAEGKYFRTIEKVCDYCGFTETKNQYGYTVTFDEGNHGTIDGQKEIDVTEKVDYVPDVEPDEDYRFIGWKIDDEGKLLSDDDVADYTVTENITFVAQYEKKNSDSGYELPEKHIERPEEKPELETKEHFQYISGYPDGTVRPNANITRAEVATIFYRLLSDDSRNAYYSIVEDFSDVQSTDWFLKAVATLTNAGILHGDEGKDTYRPNDSITRAEFATIVSFFDDLSYTGEDRFSDIAGHWANAYINSASANGWISGYPNGTFNPDAAITRAEAMTIINNVLGREVDGEGLHWKTKMWPDNPNYAWYYYEVLEATNYHDYVRESEDEAEEWTDIRPNKVWDEGAAN